VISPASGLWSTHVFASLFYALATAANARRVRDITAFPAASLTVALFVIGVGSLWLLMVSLGGAPEVRETGGRAVYATVNHERVREVSRAQFLLLRVLMQLVSATVIVHLFRFHRWSRGAARSAETQAQ
jgi:hypothetical protein